MLGYFPEPYPDELLYSVVARLKRHGLFFSDRDVVSELFELKNASATVDFPSHLNHFQRQSGPYTHYAAIDWIQQHTLYPAFLAFEPPEYKQLILHSALSDQANGLYTRTGMAAFLIKPPDYLRVCEQCYLEQRNQLGEAYWQRTLQLSSVLVCPRHRCLLSTTNIPRRPISKYAYVAAEEAQITGPVCGPLPESLIARLVLLAEQSHQLLQIPLNSTITYPQLTEYYHQLAIRHGFTRGLKVNHAAICESIIGYWSRPLLMLLDPLLAEPDHWIPYLFRKQRKTIHPLQHLVTLVCLSNQGIAQDVQNISQIHVPLPRKRPSVSKIRSPAIRRQWLDICRKHTGKGIRWLRSKGKAGSVYIWLYRHDRDWLKQHTPMGIVTHARRLRVNWDDRDLKLLSYLQALIKRPDVVDLPHRRSKTWMIKQIACSHSLMTQLDRLPKCRAFLNAHAESIAQYQRRRIFRAIRALRDKGDGIQTWKILRMAGIKSHFNTPELRSWIKEGVAFVIDTSDV